MEDAKSLARAVQPLMSLDGLRRDSKAEIEQVEFLSLYPQFDNDKKKRRAKEMFFRDDEKLEDVARVLQVPYNTVLAWAYTGKWVDIKSAEIKVRQAEERMMLAKIRLERRASIVKDQLNASKTIRDKADDLLSEAETSSQLKLAAEAVKLATDIETRALGIADDGKVSTAEDEEREAAANAKQPLVMVFGGASGLPPVRVHHATVINQDGTPQD